MNNLFKKNLIALEEKNFNLAKKLYEYIEDDIPQLVQDNGAYNLLYKNIKLHNPLNPLGEAKEIFSGARNTPVAIHLIYGIGLGYLFQLTSENSNGTVILYEPDLNILKTSFKLVDFSKNIEQSNVYITDNIDELCMYIYRQSNTINEPLLLSTSAYRKLNEQKFNELVELLQRQIGQYNFDRKYTQEKFFPLTQRLFQNLPILLNEIPFVNLKNSFLGKTAVVVSAGPTLDRNIETLKKYRDKFVLLVVGTAMKTLYANNIMPDFLVIIETNDCSKQIENLDLSNVNFITEPISHPNLKKNKYKNIYSHIASNNPINKLWSELADIDIEEYISKGTVSYTALNAARILGCSKIILVGQDLAYVEGQCYSKDSAYKDLICSYNNQEKKWEIVAKDFEHFCASLGNSTDYSIQKKMAENRLKNLNEALYFVKGINGDLIPTESVYATFIKPLSEYTRLYPNVEYINTSLVGAQIDGFKNITLEEALQNSEIVINRDVEVTHNYNTQSIIAKLKKVMQDFTMLLKTIDELNINVKNLNNDIKRYKAPTVEVLQRLKKVFVSYTNLNSKNVIFELLATAEKLDIDYQIKMVKNIDTDTIKGFVQQFSSFCITSKNKIIQTQEIIKKSISELEINV